MFMLTHGNGKHPIHLQESKPSPLAESFLHIISGGANNGCMLELPRPKKPRSIFSPVYVCTLSHNELLD